MGGGTVLEEEDDGVKLDGGTSWPECATVYVESDRVSGLLLTASFVNFHHRITVDGGTSWVYRAVVSEWFMAAVLMKLCCWYSSIANVKTHEHRQM
ncbi:hypothetical protein TSUD_247640 [Trifolium subterraneum]|uniref:Uncharacterized protein n=1 Tax=Trifolium subterraneum TaxID=3900 RepID=A0A2Z6P1Z0_TRISU|nr:hypothetical protein TSUD_247640 [Trifolium subterraneum]